MDRIEYLDILRGIAVLAIFAVNIKAMAAPFAYYANASAWPGTYDRMVAGVQAFVIDDKWRTIFTALFGAGLALFSDRVASVSVLARRIAFLGLFGLVHLLFIWMGDILLTYALAAFPAMALRQAPPRIVGRWFLIVFTVAVFWTGVTGVAPAFDETLRGEVEPIVWDATSEISQGFTSMMLGGGGDHASARATSAGEYIFLYFLLGGHWFETIAIMLAGVWGFRAGFFTLGWPTARYGALAVAGLAAATIINLVRWTLLERSNWDFGVASLVQPLAQWNGYLGAIGYAALIAYCVKRGWRPRAVAAAGRMAFTNYIAASLIGTTIAYGHAGGLFGSLSNLQLMGVVLVSWAAMLIWPPLWLAHFRFGPLEWLWRALTYGAPPPMRRAEA